MRKSNFGVKDSHTGYIISVLLSFLLFWPQVFLCLYHLSIGTQNVNIGVQVKILKGGNCHLAPMPSCHPILFSSHYYLPLHSEFFGTKTKLYNPYSGKIILELIGAFAQQTGDRLAERKSGSFCGISPAWITHQGEFLSTAILLQNRQWIYC